ncbi:hypothetical protein LCGC14_2001260 [marine sediment metagenome]|uniref:Response regulator n=2 Tax=root TaxID=1 RepID=A0A831QNV4_9FLAO|nr:response regulator [Pricia antarctica]
MDEPLLYIIDDDLISIFDIKIRLHQSSYKHRTKSFDNTSAAFNMLASDYRHIDGVPDIIMVNFDLEGMDGLAFLINLEKNGLLSDKTHVYIFSIYGVPEHMKKADGHRLIKGWFTKPISNRDIENIFSNYFNQGNSGQLRAM